MEEEEEEEEEEDAPPPKPTLCTGSFTTKFLGFLILLEVHFQTLAGVSNFKMFDWYRKTVILR